MPTAPARARHGSFPTTADMGIWATAPTPEGLLEGLALALYGTMTERRKVRPIERRTVRVTAADPTGLAVALLNELVTLFQSDGFLARSLRVSLGPGPSAEAELRGEPFDPARHARGIEVKAVTLHRALFDAAAGRARIILDV